MIILVTPVSVMDRHRSRLVILLAHEQWEGIAFANFGEGYLYALKRQGSN